MTTDPAAAAVADQYRAAAAEARAYALADLQHPDVDRVAYAPTAPPWLEAFLDTHDGEVLAGRGLICPHLKASPIAPAHVAAWRPGVVTCTGCAERGVLDRLATYEQALTCNVCGQPGTEDTMTGGRCQSGRFIVHFGAHTGCHWAPP